MSESVWSARDTSPGKIEAALRDLLAQRHAEDACFAPARVLNLVAIVDRDFKGEVENRLERVGRFHPSRLVLCAVERGRRTIDAVVSMSADDAVAQPGHLAVALERVEIDLGPQHLRGIETIVDPLLVTDLATVLWSPHRHDDALDRLRHLAQIVLIDSISEPELDEALQRAADLSRDLYVVDLAWLRSTPWRERVAAAFDPPQMRRDLLHISKVTVRHRHDSAAAAALFCGWLCARLDWRPEKMLPRGEQLVGHARGRRGDVDFCLDPMQMGSPGLGGVTIETARGTMMSLDRSEGGLKAVRRMRDGAEQTWTVMGASRGEAGILGEGVRQALLRDHTYKPALAAAKALVGR